MNRIIYVILSVVLGLMGTASIASATTLRVYDSHSTLGKEARVATGGHTCFLLTKHQRVCYVGSTKTHLGETKTRWVERSHSNHAVYHVYRVTSR